MANENWQAFWNNYRTTVVRTEDDLYLQVGKTINRKPIAESVLHQMVAEIALSLKLHAGDHLLDLCCGNGLLSCRLAQKVRHVTGIDFAPHMIEAALNFKRRPNVEYRVGDVMKPIEKLVAPGPRITKVLMNDSLAYFESSGLDELLGNLLAYFGELDFRFLMTGIPNYELRWNFYNTPERKMRFAYHESQFDNTNDGMGRWWRSDEVEEVCRKHRLRVEIHNQPVSISTYRMNALVSRR